MRVRLKKLVASFSNRTAILFSSSFIILSVVKLVTGLMVIKWVVPIDVGLWNSVSILQSYTVIAQLGILSGLNRELPYFLGKGNTDYFHTITETAEAFLRYLNIVIIAGAVIGSIGIYYYMQDIKLAIGVFSIGFLVTLSFFNTYLTITYMAKSEFLKIAKIQLYICAFTLGSVILPYYWDYYGLVIRAVAMSLFGVILIYIGRPIKVKPKFNKDAFKDLVKTGLPIYIFGYLDDISKTFSRTILLSFGTVILVGYYSPAMAILTGIAMLPSAIGQYISPQMAFSLGKFNDAKRLWKWVWKSAFALILIGLPMILVGWFTIPFFITKYFPNYVDGIYAAQFALIAGVLDSAGIGVNVLNSLKKFKWIGILTVFKLITFWCTMYYFASIMNPLEGVATGLVLAQFIYFIFTMLVCYKVTKGFNLKKFKSESSANGL